MDQFKEQAKPFAEQRTKAIKLCAPSRRTVTEKCYKFFDEETKMVGFYNKEGL